MVAVLPDPLVTRPDSRGDFLIRLPDNTPQWPQRVLDTLHQAGYHNHDNNTSDHGPAGIVVRLHPPGAQPTSQPITLRLLTPQALDTYQALTQHTNGRLTDHTITQRLTTHHHPGPDAATTSKQQPTQPPSLDATTPLPMRANSRSSSWPCGV